jgi:hypothetical protein
LIFFDENQICTGLKHDPEIGKLDLMWQQLSFLSTNSCILLGFVAPEKRWNLDPSLMNKIADAAMGKAVLLEVVKLLCKEKLGWIMSEYSQCKNYHIYQREDPL